MIRLAFLEEWPSLRANHVLPYLCERFDITYITTGDNIPCAKFKDVIVFPSPRIHLQRAPSFSRCTDALFREGKIDFAFSYACIGYLIRRTPYISLLGGSYIEDCKLSGRILPWWKKWRALTGFLHYGVPELISLKRARQVVANSQSLKSQVQNIAGLPSDAVSVVYNGVDDAFRDVFRKKDWTAAENLLYIGRFHPSKGILKLMKAFSKRPSIERKFYVIGDGSEMGEMLKLASSDPRIIILKDLKSAEIRQIMSTTRYFVFPSLQEGCPNVLLEAMASGHLCFAYDIAAVKEVLNGQGILTPLGEAEVLMDALESVLCEPEQYEEKVISGHQRTTAFDWHTCASQLEGVFERMGRMCGS